MTGLKNLNVGMSCMAQVRTQTATFEHLGARDPRIKLKRTLNNGMCRLFQAAETAMSENKRQMVIKATIFTTN